MQSGLKGAMSWCGTAVLFFRSWTLEKSSLLANPARASAARWAWTESGIKRAAYLVEIHKIVQLAICDNEIDSQGNDKMSQLCVIVEMARAKVMSIFDVCESRSWELTFLLNWYEPVLTLHFLCVTIYEMLQVWDCLEFAALKGAENHWWGSVLVYMT